MRIIGVLHSEFQLAFAAIGACEDQDGCPEDDYCGEGCRERDYRLSRKSSG
jgi:hypothetical protein